MLEKLPLKAFVLSEIQGENKIDDLANSYWHGTCK